MIQAPTFSSNRTRLANFKFVAAAVFLALIGAIYFYAAPYVKAAGEITQVGCTGFCLYADALESPRSVAVDSQDNVYVLQRGFTEAVVKFGSDGTLVGAWGSYGYGEAGLISDGAYGIAIDASDNVYIADSGNNRIQKFTSEGTFLAKWGTNGGDGTSGTGNGEFNYPHSIAIDVSGNIYVTDQFNHRVQKLASDGTFLAKWGANGGDGTSGSGNGEFSAPSGITTDSVGNVYVSDSTHRVQKFDSSGTYLAQWGTGGSGDGQLSGAYFGLETDTNDNVYIADQGNHRVQKFDDTGTYLSQFGVYGYEADNLQSPKDVAIDSSGAVYVADQYANAVKKFSSSGVYQQTFGESIDGTYLNDPDTLLVATSIASDAQGNYYVAETEANRISKFNSNNTKIATIGSGNLSEWGFEEGIDAGQFNNPFGLALDNSGNLYVADSDNNRIQKFDSAGTYLTQWGGSYGVYGSGDGEMQFPTGVAVDASGNVYVTDAENYRIQKFSNTGTYLSQFGSYGSGNGEFGGIYGSVAFDTSGNIYVPDGENSRVQKFDSSGNYLAQWVVESFPLGVTVDGLNNVYVSSLASGPVSRLLKFDTSGNLLSTYAATSLTEAKYIYGYGMAASKTTPGLIQATSYFSILNLCDQDVSTNNCTSPSSNSGQTLTYPDSEKGTTVSLILPEDVTNPTVSAVDPDTIPKDGDNQFPAGLTSFQFTTTPGATKTVTLYYDLPGNPSGYTARKYKTNSQTFIDVPNASITREDYNGKSMLKLTYSITDGGILDQDGVANGTIIDPVGLATTALADTGENLLLYIASIMSLLGLGGWMATHQMGYTRNHKQKS